MDDLSVGLSVGLSSAVWKSGGSGPDVVWHRRSDRSSDEAGPQVQGFGDRSTGRGTFGGEFGVRNCNQRGIYGVGVRQSSTCLLYTSDAADE